MNVMEDRSFMYIGTYLDRNKTLLHCWQKLLYILFTVVSSSPLLMFIWLYVVF